MIERSDSKRWGVSILWNCMRNILALSCLRSSFPRKLNANTTNLDWSKIALTNTVQRKWYSNFCPDLRGLKASILVYMNLDSHATSQAMLLERPYREDLRWKGKELLWTQSPSFFHWSTMGMSVLIFEPPHESRCQMNAIK